MVAPILHEDVIAANLHPSTFLLPDDLKKCLKYLLLGCYDRQILREPFQEYIEGVLDINTLLGRAEATAVAQYSFAKNGLPTPELDKVAADYSSAIQAKRLALHDKFALVMQCSNDPLEVN